MIGTTEELFYLYLTLQLHHAVHDSLGTRGTARNEHINGNNLLDALYDVIT